ncbi:hypothetical protein L1987_59815 [Smallanthus sonchifolius]|uniref:Uncharacterized protein n=1 Tax=Smallanthus sonchifolius TaxID=185202 RepID=A0ACB9D6K5_9ASTR|nr:hypothetical protein L1987_59815 [Smallanthus sonchifolius]
MDRHFNFRASLHGLYTLVLVVFCFHRMTGNLNSMGRIRVGFLSSPGSSSVQTPPDCTGLNQHEGFESQCEFLIAYPQCNSDVFFNYLNFFYCSCQTHASVGYIVLVIWLAALFYLLGNTAADYFCCSLEKLSNLLRLPPTLAGVTLLPLGNGAPDVFASIAAFAGTDNGDVGLSSILGGAIFVTCVVVGTISICVADQFVSIDKKCFVRDVLVLMLAVVSLAVILLVGNVSIAGAIVFVSIYVVYTTLVAANEFFRQRIGGLKVETSVPLLAVTQTDGPENGDLESENMSSTESDDVPHLIESKVPHWMWSSNVAIYSEVHGHGSEDGTDPLWGWKDDESVHESKDSSFSCAKLYSWLELPLTLPRRLTIPIIEEERWSKGYAVASVTFAPLLLGFLWNTQHDGSQSQLAIVLIYLAAAVLGCVLGGVSFICTRPDQPPQKWLLPWVLGGFFMSIIWFYMIANELVSLLVAFGLIFGINPSILGLTVLAWGNSMGDLMSNVALAVHGGEGVQIAMSGCYAGPMFNTLAGLGICMLIGSWSNRPESYTMSGDIGLFFNIGFLLFSLLWSLVMLPRNGMRPNKSHGIGLMVIYVMFLGTRLGMSIGSGSLDNAT